MEVKSIPLNRICDLNNDLQKFIAESFICIICRNFPYPPVRLNADSTEFYCFDCFLLNNKIEIAVLPTIFELNYIDNLKFKCQYTANGCINISSYKQLDKLLLHEKICEFTNEKCPNEGCNKLITKNEIKDHAEQCEYKIKYCEHCKQIINVREEHQCIEYLRYFHSKGINLLKENKDLKDKLENINTYYESKYFDIKNSFELKLNHLEKLNELNENLLNQLIDPSILIDPKHKLNLKSYYENKLKNNIKYHGDNNQYYNISLKQFGIFSYENKDFLKAIELFEKYQKILNMNENSKIDYLELANIYNYIGKSYFYLSKYVDSQKNLEKGLTIYSETNLIKEKSDTVSDSYNILGYCSFYNKDYEKAISQFNSSLRLKIHKHGEQSEEVSNLYNNLGNVLKFKGEYELAYENYYKAKEIRKQLYGDKHISVAKINNNLGLICSDLQRHKESISYFTEAFLIFKNIIGLHSIEIANTLSNLSLEYYNTNQFSKALSYQNKCLYIKINLLGDKNNDVAESFFILKDIHKALGNNILEIQFEHKYKTLKKYLGEISDDSNINNEEYKLEMIN